MRLRVKPLTLEAKKPVIILNRSDAEELDVKPLDRVELKCNGRKDTAIVNIGEKIIKEGEIGLHAGVLDDLMAREGQTLEVRPSDPPESLNHIRKRLDGVRLNREEIRQIIQDVVDDRLSDIETTAYVLSLYNHKMTPKEVAAMASTMASTGKRLVLSKDTIYDKHSIGGVPGDETSMMLVPIIAAAGLTIPKTSSRAITAPAGTADRMECLCPVDLDIADIKRVVKKTGGCLAWGGAVYLAPADDEFIRVEYPFSIDPLLLPSVMAKKKAVGAKYVVIDIPTGRGVKIKTVEDAHVLANQFIDLGKKLGMKVACISTYGEQPIGYAVGPALEARELLSSIDRPGKAPQDQVEKATKLSSELFNFARKRDPLKLAHDILSSGKAARKLRQIIEAQGGDPKIKPSDIPLGDQKIIVKSSRSGIVWWINNHTVIETARAAGAPKNKGAGILFHKKVGDRVRKGEILFEIYAEQTSKMNRALQLARKNDFMTIGSKVGMVMAEIPKERERDELFILER